jgi:alpha-methylacyl-CoA racemase
MMLADMGADVVRIERPGAFVTPGTPDVIARGRSAVMLDLKTPQGLDGARRLSDFADVVIEANRPGVAERLGLGPDELRARNPRLVYCRMTGWGQHGPRAGEVGHDINYLSLTGALHAIGRAGEPVPPLNLLADYGGGTMFLLTGLLAALVERASSGVGQVVDVAMVDGVSALMTSTWAKFGAGAHIDRRRANLLDGAAPFYDTYECSDGGFVAVGCIESQFWQEFVRVLGFDDVPDQRDRTSWPETKSRVAAALRMRTRNEWVGLFDGVDACVTPVLTVGEALQDPHLIARRTVVDIDGQPHAAPAPRFSRTPAAVRDTPEQETLERLVVRWRNDAEARE